MTPNDPPVCKLCKTNSKMILNGTEWVCHGTHALNPITNERPTPLTDAAEYASSLYDGEEILGFNYTDSDFARTLERYLAELELQKKLPKDEDFVRMDEVNEDTARLDWLISQGLCWRNADLHIAGWRIGHETEWLYNAGDGARKVIDAARAEPKK
jgi:hypothetical protein